MESSTALLASQCKLAPNQVHWRQIFCEVLLRLRKLKLCLSVITQPWIHLSTIADSITPRKGKEHLLIDLP